MTNAARKSLAALYMASVIVPARQHPCQRVDDAVVEHRPAIGISLTDLFQLPVAEPCAA